MNYIWFSNVTLTFKFKLYTGRLHKNLWGTEKEKKEKKKENIEKRFNSKAHFWEGITILFPHSLCQWYFKFWYKIIDFLLIIKIIFLEF